MEYLKKIFEHSKDLQHSQSIILEGYTVTRHGKSLVISHGDHLEFYCGRWYV